MIKQALLSALTLLLLLALGCAWRHFVGCERSAGAPTGGALTAGSPRSRASAGAAADGRAPTDSAQLRAPKLEAFAEPAADQRSAPAPSPVAARLETGDLVVRVEDGAGRALPSATVRAHRTRWPSADPWRDMGSVESALRIHLDEHGEGRVELSSGTWALWIDGTTLPERYGAPALGSEAASHVELVPGEVTTATLRCTRWSSLTGRVTRADGGEVGELRLACRPQADGNAPASTTITDEAGGFRLTHVFPGEHRVDVTLGAEGETFHASELVRLEVREGLDYDVGVLQIAEPKSRVRGRLVDEQGQPFDDLHVIAHREGERWNAAVAGARTDAEGRYTLWNVPRGSWNLQCTEPPRELAAWMQPVTIEVDSDDVVVPPIALKRSAPFELTLLFRVANERDERSIRVAVQHELAGKALPAMRAVRLRTQAEDAQPVVYPRDVRYGWRTLASQGTVNVEVRLGQRVWNETLLAAPSATREVVLDLEPAASTVAEGLSGREGGHPGR
ncbi:MAG: carboxypeptidase-like regulatory domain-containing protein [Planctomycetota bacterium]